MILPTQLFDDLERSAAQVYFDIDATNVATRFDSSPHSAGHR